MNVSRREFLIAGAVAGASLILPLRSAGESGAASESVRYIHAELRAGEWTRDELEALAETLATEYGLSPLESSVIGSDQADETAAALVLTVVCAGEARIVVRVSERPATARALI